MANTLESLEIQVQHKASGADAEISNVANAIKELKTALTGVPAMMKELATAFKDVKSAFNGGTAKYDKFAESLTNIAAAAEMLGEHSNDVNTLATAMNTMSEVKVTAGSFNALAKGVENVANAANGITANAIANLDKMVTSLAKLQGIDLQGLGSAMNAVRRGDSVTPKEPPTPVPDGLRELISNASAIDMLEAKLVSLRAAMEQAFNAGDVVKAYGIRDQILQTEAALKKAKQAANGASKATKSVADGMKDVEKSAAKAHKPLDVVLKSLGRVAFYRAIRTVLKEIAQAFQEGLQNAYAYSQGIASEGHRFSVAMDSMSSAGLKMKNQLGSAFIALLAAIAPIINAIIGLVTKLADAVSQFLAVFTGGTYLKAKDVPARWAEGAAGAAKATKEWRNQLLGFDEINRLDAPTEPSGGGGGGSALDPMSMFEDTPVDGFFKTLRDRIVALKESLDFEPLRKSWDRFKDSIKSFGDVVATGLVWAWDNVLYPLSKWTIETAAPVLINILASAFNFLTAVLERLAPVFDWIWQKILKPVFTFIGNVAIKTLQGFSDLLQDLADLISGKISFSEFIKGLTNTESIIASVCTVLGALGLIGLFNYLKNTVLVGLFLGIGKLNTLLSFLAANPIVAVIAAIAALIYIGIKLYQNWDTIKAKFEEFMESITSHVGNGILEWQDFAYVAIYAVQSVINVIKGIVSWIETLIQGIQLAIAWFKELDIVKKSEERAQQIQEDGSIYLQGFASGGFPDEGQLFMAREAGPEMVGTVGGRTAVATNNDIVAAVSAGVANAVSSAMGNRDGNVNVKVYLDSREIKNGQQRLNRAWGV